MKNISSINEINYEGNESVSFLATVTSITSEGDGSYRPIKALLKLEDSGEPVAIVTWNAETLTMLKELTRTDDVYKFTVSSSVYKNEMQLKMLSFENAHMKSTKKVLKNISIDALKSEITNIVNSYLRKGTPLYEIVNELILKSDKFWIWPAAQRMHHAYPSGLAKHSLNVCRNAISIWQTYSGENLSIEGIVAGALLHDIGKLSEYTEFGERTVYGDLVSHTVESYSMILRTALKLGVEPKEDVNVMMLLHSVLAHHEKYEFGAPVKPTSLEAFIVARADALDAAVDAVEENIAMVPVGKETNIVPSINTKMYKWHN